ncbi:hypothetical protein ABIB50_002128 [Mucilaginibacter sp. UYCu711]
MRQVDCTVPGTGEPPGTPGTAGTPWTVYFLPFFSSQSHKIEKTPDISERLYSMDFNLFTSSKK